MKCTECKEGLIEDDALCGKVCTSCGCVFEEEVFATDCQLEGTTNVKQNGKYADYYVSSLPRSLLSHRKPSESKVVTFGKEVISYVASYLHLSSVTKEEIEVFFAEIANKCLKSAVFPRKKPLVACCTYVVLRRKNFPIMISKICNFLQISSSAFGRAYKIVRKYSDVVVSSPSVDEMVPTVLKTINFQDEILKITPLVKRILHVAHDCWIVHGRTPQPLIIAASYIAWKSLSCERRKCSFLAFCKKTFVKEHRSVASERVSDLCNALIKLAEELPWVEKGKINKNDIPYMLDSILNHSKLLASSVAPREDGNEHLSDSKEFQAFRTVRQRKKSKLCDDTESYSDDFDDSSLNCYLRTEDEVKALERFLKEKESESHDSNDETV